MINQLAPIYVSFAVPGRYLGDIRRYQAQRPLVVTARGQAMVAPGAQAPAPPPPTSQAQTVAPGQGATVAVPAGLVETGRVSFIDNAVDPTTGTIKLKGTFQNASQGLWPGLFVTVMLSLTTDENVLVVPATAVQPSASGQYVYVVNPDRTAQVRPVTVARQSGEDMIIAQGLAAGEEVVIDGQLRLTPGSQVSIAGARGGEGGRGEAAADGGRPGRPAREQITMNFAETFIRRPVATTLLVLTILIFGVMGYLQLPVADLPTIDYPTIQVNANLPGANPDTMASSVATPLEKQFATISGITSITSRSGQGNTNISLTFDLDRDIDAAAQDVQTAIARSSRGLPPGMPAPPSYNKSNPTDMPVLFLTLTSDTLPMAQVDRYAETVLAQRLSMITGVAQVNVFGAQKFAVRVDLDPTQLAARQIGIDQVTQAINGSNVNRPTGTLYGPNRNFVVQSTGQLMTADQFRPIVVAYRNGNPVRLEEVARVYDGVENPRNASWYNGKPALYLGVQRLPGTNTVEVVDRVKAMLPELQAQLPGSIQLAIRSDRSVSIRESVHDVKFTLILTVVLVVLVIFLFLRNLSATIIPSLALPFSIVGTFAVMWALDYSLNNLTLMALTLSVGFVVDDAIVMLENIVRHMEMGKTRMQAALDGSKEIAFTIVSMTVSLAAVFIPILFMGGIVGRLMHEFAVTIGAAILVSGLVSLTLTPMLCSRFLKPLHSMKHGWFYNVIERFFDAWLKGYAWTLRGTLRFKAATMVVSALLLVGTVYMFQIVPKGFIPSVDTGQINGSVEFAQGVGYETTVVRMRQLMDLLDADPERRGLYRGLRRRPSECRPEAARRAAGQDGRHDHRGAASEDEPDPRDPRQPDEPSRDPHRRRPGRRARRRRRVSDRAAGSGHRGALSRRAAVRGQPARNPGPAGRQLGSAAPHAAADGRSRS